MQFCSHVALDCSFPSTCPKLYIFVTFKKPADSYSECASYPYTYLRGVKPKYLVIEKGVMCREYHYLPEYIHILELLAKEYGIKYNVRFEKEFLQQPGISGVLQEIIKSRVELGKYLMPSTGVLALRAPCPTCGLID